jgi:tripartite-type tricarboxylate transporter receptor subunit TctC
VSLSISRRSLISGSSAALVSSALPVKAQTAIPDKSVRLIVGFRPNSGPTLIAEPMAPVIERRIGRHVTIESRPSLAGTGAAEMMMRGPLD